jgi:hypothetical protein
MLLIDDGNGGVISVRARVHDHIVARLHAGRIDRDLASGASPDASAASALRARALTTTRTRRGLAYGLQRGIAAATMPAAAAVTGAPLNRAGVLAASADLAELRRRLLANGPVGVRGVAQTQLLLTTGTGPLHNRRCVEHLATSVRRAIDALAVLDPH